jgi:N-acetylneuraminate synthase
MRTVELAGRAVGPGQPCFIIAEAGVNHNGDPRLAERLVDAAREAGADAVKFQTWVTEKLVTPDARLAEYQARNLGQSPSQYAMLKQLELGHDDFRRIKAHADRRGILFLSTPDEEDSADFLEELGVPAFKVGSGEVTNLPFLRHLARKGRPLILSTGMSTLGEVEAAVGAVEAAGNRGLVLLHCVSAYPAEPADCNLRAIDTLAAAFGCPAGFSDHTLGTEVAVAAAARGACVLEKHLTLDTQLPGPDHRASLDPREFAALVRAVRTVERALGDGAKRPTPAELETKKLVQKTIVAARRVRAGERLTADALALRRAGAGLPAAYLPLVLGRAVNRELDANQALTGDLLQ